MDTRLISIVPIFIFFSKKKEQDIQQFMLTVLYMHDPQL